jgi:2-polyprenyl-3-methyl-5-hydroxy-6-metoxy-1,4-benzoquinol methylase
MNGNGTDHESACARIAERFREPWLRHYVRGKLRRDNIYPTAYEIFCGSAAPILDVGCGVGLLAFYLRERGCGQPVVGLDADARKIRRGVGITEKNYRDVDLRFHDVEETMPEFSGNIALFDVLHYLSPEKQSVLLDHLSHCVAPGGVLVIRDCPREPRPRYWLTVLAEKFAQTISWNRAGSLHFPSRVAINAAFDASDFARETRPLWGASPFNNHIFIFRRHASATVPAAV